MDIGLFILLGAVGGLLTAMLVAKVAPSQYRSVFALMLVFIAAIYVGPMIEAPLNVAVPELAFAIALSVLCLFALQRNLLWLVAGYALHGGWDALHGSVFAHVLPHWYAPMCIGFDFAVALHIYSRYRRTA